MSARLARVLLVVAALSLAWVAWTRAYADLAFRAGLGFTDRPADDVPGRLEAYEEAVERAPTCFTYRLRAGQIRLSRASTRSPTAEADLAAAQEHLAVAVAVHPLDARAAVATAQAHMLRGRVEAALEEARRAVAIGPRHVTAQLGALRVAVSAWRVSGRVEALELALDVDAERRRSGGPPAPPRDVIAALRSRENVVLGDLLEACAGDAERFDTAHRWLSLAVPDLAPVLEAAAPRGGRRR